MLRYTMAKKKENIFLILILVGIIYLIYIDSQKKSKKEIIQINIDEKRKRKTIDEPRRYYDSRFISRDGLSINEPTRGEPPEYQQVGILRGDGDENIKPLYGRQTYRGSNQWNYFTSLDSHLATKIPVYQNGTDCTDERGCKEINKGEDVKMGEDGDKYKASLYGTIAPRYIPYV